MGRPSTYSDEIADEICQRLAGGESILQMCKDDHIPPKSVIFQWLLREPRFQDNYARARGFWAESEFENMMQIADTVLVGEKTTTKADGKVEVTTGDCVERAKLQVETRKWALARMNKRFTDRIDQRLSGPEGEALKIVVTGIRPTPENSE
jgi:hypothetical protein